MLSCSSCSSAYAAASAAPRSAAATFAARVALRRAAVRKKVGKELAVHTQADSPDLVRTQIFDSVVQYNS